MCHAVRMIQRKVMALGAIVVLAASLSACASSSSNQQGSGGGSSEQAIGGDVIAPLTMSVNELQGAEVELLVGQVLNINTDSLAVDSYTGEVSDSAVVEFSKGDASGSAEFNPGVKALKVGKSTVTMTNEQGGIQPLEFTVTVVEKQ